MIKITIITLGESGVGKSSLLNTFRTGKFKESTRSTFVDQFSKRITVENIQTDLFIWDTAGQEQYNSLIKRYYAMADGVLLMYDINDPKSVSKLSKWLHDLRLENETAEIIIVGNKNEDPTTKLVNSSDAKDFAENVNIEHMEASAKTGQNVDSIFLCLTKKILEAKGILPLSPVTQQNSEESFASKHSSQSSGRETEQEISFSYYGKSASPKILPDEPETADEAILTDEVKTPKMPGECNC